MDLDHAAANPMVLSRDARFDGRRFIAVRTTGIYCRPGCPARAPRAENTVVFPTAAAAQEAGFRPCLRCRPETAPELDAWRGIDDTVSRALLLIEEGAVDELPRRLGVDAARLDRLFRQHLGASPAGVARTRRVLLAKQMVHETRLPMAEVARASGFGGVRRLDETFLTLFGRPPEALRRSGTVAVPAATQAEITLKLRYRPPYDWEAMLAYLRPRAIAGIESVEGDLYRRTIGLGGRQGSVSVRPDTGNALRVGLRVPELSLIPATIARLRRMFDLAADPEAIGAHLAADAALAPLVAVRPGLRVPGAWDGFELAMRAILGQQITVAAAIRLAGKLVATHGAPYAESDGVLTHVFPTPERLAGADLTTLGMPRGRAAALSSIAAAVLADPSLFGVCRSLEAAVAKLRALPGVGEWTAQYIAMRQLREPDAFPAADIGLMRAMADVGGKRPTAAELLARAENWRPWRSYAAQHLWASHAGAADSAKIPAKDLPARGASATSAPLAGARSSIG